MYKESTVETGNSKYESCSESNAPNFFLGNYLFRMYEIHTQYPVRVAMSSRTWLREQETSWYREGMHALVSRWRKAVDVDGDYVEK
jgi:hypothetical protein